MGKVTFKSVVSSLWPFGRSASMPTGNTLTSSTSFGLPFINYLIFDNKAYWHQLTGLQSLIDWFYTNPVLYSVVMIKAREYSNMRIKVRNRRTGQDEPEGTSKQIPRKIYDLFEKPNVLQGRTEFLQQRKIFREVTGNSFTYGNWPLGFAGNPTAINTLTNPWPQFMEFKLTGKFFDATKIEEIIEGWRFKYGQYEKNWKPSEILHQNAPNLDPRNGLIFGGATALSLTRPLTNIDMAYESRNVIMKNRGMRAIITAEKADASGKIPLLPDEKESVQKSLEEYGTRENQKQFFFSDMPLKAVPIDQDVMKLGLFEEIATDAMLVCNAFGVPEILLKLYLQGATFENQEASVRRLYQGTLIPEAEDDVNALNEFLGLNDTEWMIVPSFDHLPVLQKSEKEKAESNQRISIYSEKLFRAGAMTLNGWLDQIGMQKINQPYASQTILEMDEEIRKIILESLKGSSGSSSSEASAGSETESGSGSKRVNGYHKEEILN